MTNITELINPSITILIFACIILGVFSFMIKAGVFDSDAKSANTDKIDSLGTQGVVSMPESKYEIEYHPDIEYNSKMNDLLLMQKACKNHLYKIKDDPEKTKERISVKSQLAQCEQAISDLMKTKSVDTYADKIEKINMLQHFKHREIVIKNAIYHLDGNFEKAKELSAYRGELKVVQGKITELEGELNIGE